MRSLLTKKILLFLVPPLAAGAAYAAGGHLGGSDPVVTEVLGDQVVKSDAGSPPGQDKDNEPNGSFTIAGAAAGLYPGARLALPLTFVNPQSFGIRVTSVSVAVANPASRPGVTPQCSAAAIQIGLPGGPAVAAGQPIQLALDVAKEGTAPAQLEVRMVADPPDACQNASFTLAYSGTAVKS